MVRDLKSRKQEFAKDAIYEAALDLFMRQGFEETSVDDVAKAAGISRRSFFRYFTTKDHLLGHNMVRLGDVLVTAVTASPAESSSYQVVRDAVMGGLSFGTSHPRTRQVIEITTRNLSARYAHRSRRVDIEIRLSQAFAARTRMETPDHVRPRMLAILTLDVADLAVFSWFKGEFDNYSKAVDHVLSLMSDVFATQDKDQPSSLTGIENAKSRGKKHL
jgi:AcrR family transcriptional regulator